MKRNFIKYSILPVVIFFITGQILAQVLYGDNTLNASAIMEINTEDKGMSLSQLTHQQLSFMSDPVEGLQVYCRDHHARHFYDGEKWISDPDTNLIEPSLPVDDSNSTPSLFFIESFNTNGKRTWDPAYTFLEVDTTTSDNPGQTINITTAILPERLIDFAVFIEDLNGEQIPPDYNYNPGYNYQAYISGNGIITVKIGSSSSHRLLLRPMKVYVIYRE